ncbi:C40 family peptidase [Deinococcus sp.]|uniref:C40 family peptidase n=1 Tax=Deinococcus sp. TaxID=47478 RepID=UPI003B5B0050
MNAFRVLLTLAALSGSATAATYTVKAGDTLTSVAQNYKLEPQKLMQLNGLASTTLEVGQQLNVGGKASSAATVKAAPKQAAPVASAPAQGSGYVRSAALRFLGIRYAHGGTGNWGMDCSGYTQAVYRSMGVTLPRTAVSQYRTGRAVGRSQLQVGDLMFFNTLGRGVSHVAIYLGNGDFANANSYYGKTMVDNLSNPYWSRRYVGARRVL